LSTERLTRIPRVREAESSNPKDGQILHSTANGPPPLQHLRK